MLPKIKEIAETDIKDIKIPNIKLPDSLNIPIDPRIISAIFFKKDKRVNLFLSLSLDKRKELLRSISGSIKRDLLMAVPETDLADIIHSVDPDEATDLLQMLTKNKREKVLRLVSQQMRDSLSTLLEFDADTAAGLMTLDYILVNTDDNITTVANQFRLHEKRTGRPPIILVINNSGKLAGYLPGHELGFARKTDRIEKYVKRILTISYAAKHEEVLSRFVAHPRAKIAVLNDSDSVMGIIYSDDVLKLIRGAESSSLYDFAGIREEESVSDSARFKVKNRYRWLIINLGTAFLASFVVSRFEHTLSSFVILAAYMPIVAGMGGNAATQTLAVLVRGISLKQINLSTAWKTLQNELNASLINGLIVGLMVAVVVQLTSGNTKIAIVLGTAMIINFFVAAFFGTLVPLIMSKLGKDPATSAAVFITTATDILGFMAFLGLATIILF